jgi:SAM-dependent MidA family methyltransferase
MIWIDYGFAREDYYHPGRSSGTLRTFCQHQAGEDPLAHPGATDITAHVDFTAVREAAESLGACEIRLQSQGTWLTGLAREWLLSQENNPQASALRQFQTLTHPAQLGRSFQVIEMAWNLNNAT